MFGNTYRRIVQRSKNIRTIHIRQPTQQTVFEKTSKNIILNIPNINRFTTEFLYFTHFTPRRPLLIHNMLYKST